MSLAVSAVGTVIVSCSEASATPTAVAPTAVPAAAVPNVVPAAGAPAVNVAAAPKVAPATGATPASATATHQPTTAAAPAAPATTTPTVIKMTDQYKFDPDAVTIAKGTTVEWQSSGAQPHTVTFDPAKAMTKSHVSLPAGVTPWDSGLVDAGKSYKYTFTVVGVYRYICIPHEAMGMVGTITVT